MGHTYKDEEYDYEEEGAEAPVKVNKARGRSPDYEQKKRRAERILEQARIRELLGYDVDYYD